MRKISFITGEYYHIYNRGVDKREIFSDRFDVMRFFESLREFNNVNEVGSLYQQSFRKKEDSLSPLGTKSEALVDIIAFCLLGNHFHLILKPRFDDSISKYMQKVSAGYTRYFNDKYERVGSLFQGVFKASHIDTDEYLQKVVAYVNLNFLVHNQKIKFMKPELLSSWSYYSSGVQNLHLSCVNDNAVFPNNYSDYKIQAMNALKETLQRRNLDDEYMKDELFE